MVPNTFEAYTLTAHQLRGSLLRLRRQRFQGRIQALPTTGRIWQCKQRRPGVFRRQQTFLLLSVGTLRVQPVTRTIHGVPITRNTAKKKSVISSPSR